MSLLHRWRVPGIFVLVAALGLALGTARMFQVRRYGARPPLVDIGGRRIETRIEGAGSPTVVFETGFTGGLALYETLQDRVAARTRTLAYERAGLGHSDPGPEPRTALQIARELHALLAATGTHDPVVLVGHSAGAIYMRVFAHTYPGEVAALVFLDPATAASYGRMQRSDPKTWQSMSGRLPAGLRRQWLALPASLAEASSAWPLPAVPCAMITATKPLGEWGLSSPEDMQAWLGEHHALLKRLPEPTSIVLPSDDHLTILDDPRVAAVILNTIQRAKRERR